MKLSASTTRRAAASVSAAAISAVVSVSTPAAGGDARAQRACTVQRMRLCVHCCRAPGSQLLLLGRACRLRLLLPSAAAASCHAQRPRLPRRTWRVADRDAALAGLWHLDVVVADRVVGVGAAASSAQRLKQLSTPVLRVARRRAGGTVRACASERAAMQGCSCECCQASLHRTTLHRSSQQQPRHVRA